MRMFYAEIARFENEYEGVGIFSTEERAYEFVHEHYSDLEDDDIFVIEWVVDEGVLG